MNTYTFNFNPFSPFNSSFFIPYSDSSSDYESESQSEKSDFSDHNCFSGEEQMSFITDLFHSQEEEYVPDDPDSVSDPVNNGVSENDTQELGLGFELGGGLRVVGIESDSDSEEVDTNSGSDFSNLWNCPRFDEEDHREGGSEEIELDEVNARIVDHDHADERERLSSVIDRIEEISVSSEISSEGEDAVRTLDWEILLAVNNLERNLEFENDSEGFVYTAEFDTLIGEFVESVRALKGSPPAAKSIVDNLPLVVLNEENVMENHVVCAVCKDEISMEEKVTRLPCRHYYHGECITPWLSIRNTCPVCRFEFPMDDVDYERRKNGRNGELQVGYNFDLSS